MAIEAAIVVAIEAAMVTAAATATVSMAVIGTAEAAVDALVDEDMVAAVIVAAAEEDTKMHVCVAVAVAVPAARMWAHEAVAMSSATVTRVEMLMAPAQLLPPSVRLPVLRTLD